MSVSRRSEKRQAPKERLCPMCEVCMVRDCGTAAGTVGGACRDGSKDCRTHTQNVSVSGIEQVLDVSG